MSDENGFGSEAVRLADERAWQDKKWKEDRDWEIQKRREDRDWEERKRKQDHGWEHAIRRDGMAAQGLRAILLLNGGGTVALLAFLQAIWTEPTAVELIPWVIASMVILLLGATAAGWVHFQRYKASETYQVEGREMGQEMTKHHKDLTKFAFRMFLFGIAIVAFGVYLNLPIHT